MNTNICEINDIDIIKKVIHELILMNQIKALRRLLKNNPYCIQLKPKDLNKEYNIKGYKFSKRNTNLVLIIDKKDLVNDKCIELMNRLCNTQAKLVNKA